MIKGIISSVSFKWTGTGIEGMGQDGITSMGLNRVCG
jgi:hypothetical protein